MFFIECMLRFRVFLSGTFENLDLAVSRMTKKRIETFLRTFTAQYSPVHVTIRFHYPYFLPPFNDAAIK
jgi:hypothetical protein